MKHVSFLLLIVLMVVNIEAQVPVRDEPRHHPVLVNKYVRLLDVWLPPHDTSLYHIHATPSLFIILSNTNTASQVKGEGWQAGPSAAGTTWFRSFTPDTLIHRVANIDNVPFHVNDIEIIGAFQKREGEVLSPLPYTVLLNNEKAFTYQLNRADINGKLISKRGPVIAELVSGDGILLNRNQEKKSLVMKAGSYVYIEPGISFNFSSTGKGDINLIVFEIK